MTQSEKFDIELKKLHVSDGGIYQSADKKDDFESAYPSYIKRERIDLLEKLLPTYEFNKFKIKNDKRLRSVGSSELYNLRCFSKDDAYGQRINILENLEFEYTKAKNGICIPHFDASFTIDKTRYFIEAKCHEIFSSHTKLYIPKSYMHFFQNGDVFSGLFDGELTGKGKYIAIDGEYPDSTYIQGCKVKIKHFEIKQFICHLLGIIGSHEENSILVYNVFKPSDCMLMSQFKEFKTTYDALENEIRLVYELFKVYFQKYNIKFGYVFNSEFNTITKFTEKVIILS